MSSNKRKSQPTRILDELSNTSPVSSSLFPSPPAPPPPPPLLSRPSSEPSAPQQHHIANIFNSLALKKSEENCNRDKSISPPPLKRIGIVEAAGEEKEDTKRGDSSMEMAQLEYFRAMAMAASMAQSQQQQQQQQSQQQQNDNILNAYKELLARQQQQQQQLAQRKSMEDVLKKLQADKEDKER
jgi:hypothetical protein